MTILKRLCLYSYFVDLYFYIGDEFCIDRLCTESSVTFFFLFLPLRKGQDGIGGMRKVSFLKCLVIVNIVTAWSIYIRLLNACLVVFFSLWEISDGVCVILLPARACVSVCAYKRMCVTSTVDNVCVCTACLCPLCKTGRLSHINVSILPVCVCLCVRTRVCVALAQLSVSECSCDVLVHADAWPV